jgi:hypothetical protein
MLTNKIQFDKFKLERKNIKYKSQEDTMLEMKNLIKELDKSLHANSIVDIFNKTMKCYTEKHP